MISFEMEQYDTTPGTVKYRETGNGEGRKRTQYVLKDDYKALGEPRTIRVTIDAA